MRNPLNLFRRSPWRDTAHDLYVRAVEQARQPGFYLDCDVPDTPDGRFDMVALHVFLVMRRLKADHDRTEDLAQELFDVFFADMDQNLREMGIGDMGIGKRIKGLAKGFYGRLAVYDAALEPDAAPDALSAALRRNLYRKTEPSEESVVAVAAYVRHEASALAAASTDDLLAGRVSFGSPPALVAS